MPTLSPDWGLESLQSEGWSWAEPFRIRGLLSQAISCTSFTYLEEALHLPSIPSLTLLTLYEWWQGGKDSPCQSKRHKRHGFDPWVRKIPWRRKWQHNPVLLPGKFHGHRSLAGYSPRGHKESDTTEHRHTDSHCRSLCSLNTWSPLTCFYFTLCSRWIYLSFPWERKVVCSRAWPVFSGLLLGVDCYTGLWEFYFTGQFSRKLDLSTLMK